MPTRRTSSEPATDLALLQREINQLFERLAGFERSGRPASALWEPSADVFDCNGNLTIVMEVPGLAADSLRVVAREGSLVISGERRERRPAGIAAFHCMERPQGRFTREIPIGAALDVRNATARLETGILTIRIPRLKDRRGRETVIPVERA